jgi:cytochrome c
MTILKIRSLFLTSLFLSALLVLFGFVHFIPKSEENHTPVVRILSPKNNSLYQWGTPATYSVSVSDAEDGESKFQEIESSEVLLQIRYLPDSLKLQAELADETRTNPPGLTDIRKSDCLNCHAFNGKLIGPSFAEISKRYSDTPENRLRLEKSILDGLTGTWGREVMPTHPQLSTEEAGKMVTWILKNAGDPTVFYYRGTDGSFRIKAPELPVASPILIITASYIDHGLKDDAKASLRGQDIIVLKIK